MDCSTRIKVVCLAAMLACCFGVLDSTSEELVAPQAMKLKEMPEQLANEYFEIGSVVNQLHLMQHSIPYQNFDLEKYLKDNPTQVDPPNMALVLARNMPGRAESTVVWFSTYQNYRNNPPSLWRATIVRHPSKQILYLIVSESFSYDLNLYAYEVQIDQNLGKYPIEFDTRHYDQWPKSARPIATLNTKLQTYDICGVGAIRALPEEDSLLVYGEPDYGKCKSEYYRLNLTTHKWLKVTPQESEPITIGPDGSIIYPAKPQ